eukprot:CAMPEP_0204589220 /NCGR_PEP_ID=MMETSP0661-20131031/49076_1 /ASSEMBLY_ACC=CAM_ASM_000606 /TAXON_ID=109239 /ORGANISM="Alexandrium margalefi, Strain AMGDE01CS-322" /LENGTH=349 /DNA_ID=CAMNT_0051599127 /DNA_START=190 /DNA_END=1236 /DNA_ORIENTATION=+
MTSDPAPGKDINGNRRGKNTQTCDWQRKCGDVWHRVEAKYARMTWVKTNPCWLLRFGRVKFEEFDVLLLIVYAPWGLELWQYDLGSLIGVSTVGKATSCHGHQIKFYGRFKELCLLASWSQKIRPRLEQGAQHVVTLSWSHPLIDASWLQVDAGTREYASTPFFNCSGRGLVFERIARAYDAEYRHFALDVPQPGERVDGRLRGPSSEACDWLRTHQHGVRLIKTRRVETKSARITWNRTRKEWVLMFTAVKVAEFDDLVLIVYAPWGLELWDYNIEARVGLCSHGKATAVTGQNIFIYGKRGEYDLRKSWESKIAQRLQKAASQVAALTWDHPLVRASLGHEAYANAW